MLPLTDLDPVLLARAAPTIEEAGARVFLPSPEVALGCQDKWECHLMLERAGLPSPPTWLPATPPGRPAVPGAGQAAPGLRGAPHTAAPIRSSSRSSCATGGERHPAGPAGREFSIDCLGDLGGRPLGACRRMIQAKGGEQIKGETLDDPQLTELGAATVASSLGLAGPSTVQCFREGPAILGITDINTRFGAPSRCPRRPARPIRRRSSPSRPASGPPARVGAHVAGVVMTRFLDQTILRREPRGLAPSRASTRVRRTWSARSPSGTTAACCGAAVGSSSPRPSPPRSWASS